MRSAEFDREQVLRAAIVAFTAKGYSQTSMQDLKLATGLHPGSIYCAFENKQGLLVASLEQYGKDRGNEFKQLFAKHSTILIGLKNYLENTVSEVSPDGLQRGCLSQVALNELAQIDPVIENAVTNNFNAWLAGFVEVFDKALQNGEVNSNRTPEQRAQCMVMGIYGLRTYAHTYCQPEIIMTLAQQLYEDVSR